MKVPYSIIIVSIIFFSCKKDNPVSPTKPPVSPGGETEKFIDYNKDISIANWNIEWFGDGSMFAGNLDAQEANAGKILKYLNADLFGLCEIVDTMRLGRMVRNNLGDEYKYTVSPYPSGGQKLAFVYNKNIFRNVKVRAFMGVSSTAYYSFAMRYPYLLTTDVYVNGTTHLVNFILLHAKADADATSYNRRLSGATELKDSLDQYFSGKYFFLMGDFNDNFNKSITSGKGTPYQNFLNDNADYNALTLPLNTNGYQSTLGFTNSVIDQQMVSSNFTKWYNSASTQIRTDVINVVPDYKSGNTSDHYPVTSVFHITQ